MSTAPSSRSATSARTTTKRIVVVLAAALATAPSRAAVVDEIVVKVNNRIVTASEFEDRQKALFTQVSQEHPGPGMTQELQEAQDVLLANIITEALLLERATAVFDMDRIRLSLVDDFKKQQNIPGDPELEQALKDQGMTRKELEEHLIRIAVPNEIINYDVKRKISVSETEMQDYYDQHRPLWETPETVTFKEIVVLYTDETHEEAAARAGRIVAEARGGADFAGLVAQHSEAGTREVEGLIGPIPTRDLQAALAASVKALAPEQISDPVDTGRSLHILRLETRVPASIKPFGSVRDQVHDAVREQKFRPRFDAYLQRLWKENHIEVTPKFESWLVVSPLKPRPTT